MKKVWNEKMELLSREEIEKNSSPKVKETIKILLYS